MVKLSVAALLAAALVAPALANYASFDEYDARDVAEQGDLYERSDIEALSEIFTREELNEYFGRDIEELSTREFEELMERQVEVDEDIFARHFEEVEVDARFLKKAWNGLKNWWNGKPKQDASGAVPAEEQPVQARDEAAPEAAGPPPPEAAETAPKGPASSPAAGDKPKTKKNTNLVRMFLNWYRREGRANEARKANGGKSKDAGGKKADKAPAPPAPEAAPASPAPEAAPAPEPEAPAARDYIDELIERELATLLDEPVERSLEYLEDMYERDYDEDIYERDYEEEVYERDFEDDVYERDFEDDVYERDFEEDFQDIFGREYEYDELD